MPSPRLAQRLVQVGPFDNETYRQLTKVAKGNGHDTAEEFLGKLAQDVLAETVGECLWVPVAVTRSDYEFAVGKWGGEVSPMLDQVLADGLDAERAAGKRVSRCDLGREGR